MSKKNRFDWRQEVQDVAHEAEEDFAEFCEAADKAEQEFIRPSMYDFIEPECCFCCGLCICDSEIQEDDLSWCDADDDFFLRGPEYVTSYIQD